MDLNDAADMRDEAEQAFNDARKTRGKRDPARMNEKAGYQVLPPLVTLVVEAVDHGRSVTFIGLPFDRDSPACTRWAFGLVGMGGVAEG